MIGWLALGLLLAACSKQLNQQPPSNVVTSQFYSNTSDFQQAVNGVYNQLRNYPDQVLWMGEMRSDNVNAGSDGNRDWQGINDFSPNLTATTFITTAWDNNFNGIYNANSVLDNLATKGGNVTDPALRARFGAECHFLRAFYYFQLVRLYGPVPLVDHVVSSTDVAKIKRSPVADVYKLIISDLQKAKDSLPASYAVADVGRATSWAAKALLGLVYLTRSGPTYSGVEGPTMGTNEWDLALTQFNDIINNSKFTFGAKYPDIFAYDKEDNPEVIFDVQFMTTNNGADFPSMLVNSGYWNGLGISGSYGNGYGSTSFDVSKNLRSSYVTSAAGAVDVRDTFNIQFKYNTTTTAPIQVDTSNPFIKKYINIAKRGTDYKDWPINFIVIRLTDVMMMKAECILNGATGGTMAEVNDIVNKVRTRAGVPVVTGVDLPFLMEERRREFLGEGLRWNDMVREGMAVTTMNNWIGSDALTNLAQVIPAFIIYPVPSAEILASAGLYTQNPGYH